MFNFILGLFSDKILPWLGGLLTTDFYGVSVVGVALAMLLIASVVRFMTSGDIMARASRDTSSLSSDVRAGYRKVKSTRAYRQSQMERENRRK